MDLREMGKLLIKSMFSVSFIFEFYFIIFYYISLIF